MAEPECSRAGAASVEATLSAPGRILVTFESRGATDLNRELEQRLQTVFDKEAPAGLRPYRIEFRPTEQPGQPPLPAAGAEAAPLQPGQGATGPLRDQEDASVPEPERERLLAALAAAQHVFTRRLLQDPEAHQARSYLTNERRIPSGAQQTWALGYAPTSDRERWHDTGLIDELRQQGFTEAELIGAGLAKVTQRGQLYDFFAGRITFPIHDADGAVVGFTARRIAHSNDTEQQAKERGPKYINSPETAVFRKSEVVFGLHHPAQQGAGGPAVAPEGPLDVIAVALASAGMTEQERYLAGAPMGTALTQAQLELLRGTDPERRRAVVLFPDADAAGRKALLSRWELLQGDPQVKAASSLPAKDAGQLWQEDEGHGTPHAGAKLALALQDAQPLLNAVVEAQLMQLATSQEQAAHRFTPDTRHIKVANAAARYIREAIAPGARASSEHLEKQAAHWAKQLHASWGLSGPITATAILHGPGDPDSDGWNRAYERALDLLGRDPDGYFNDDPLVQSRGAFSSSEDADAANADTRPPVSPAEASEEQPGTWPTLDQEIARLKPERAARTTRPLRIPTPTSPDGAPRMPFVASLVGPDGTLIEVRDRHAAAYRLHTDLLDRIVQRGSEPDDPVRLPHQQDWGSMHGIALATSVSDATTPDPTITVWFGQPVIDSLSLAYSEIHALGEHAVRAAVECRAAQAAGILGRPLSATWHQSLSDIIPSSFPALPAPADFARLLATLAEGTAEEHIPDQIRARAQQAAALYTAGRATGALEHLALAGHVWVLRDDGAWVEEPTASGPDPAWSALTDGFRQEAQELKSISTGAAALPPASAEVSEQPLAVDLSAAHHSVHEALVSLRPYSTGLPGMMYEQITDLVAQLDVDLPAWKRLRGPDGEQLMHRAKSAVVRVLEGLSTVAAKIRLFGLSQRLERVMARLRGLPVPEGSIAGIRPDRRLQDLAQIERGLEREMASGIALADVPSLQEQWIVNRARWRARYEQVHGHPTDVPFLSDDGLIAGAPPIPNPVAAHEMLLRHLAARVAELRDVVPGKPATEGSPAEPESVGRPYDPTADLFVGVAWAYQQRLVGAPPPGDDPEGPLPTQLVHNAAVVVTTARNASPLTVRRALGVSEERANRLLHHLEGLQVLGPYQGAAPRTVVAQRRDLTALLGSPSHTPVEPAAAVRPLQESTQDGSPSRAVGEPTESDTDLSMYAGTVANLVSKLDKSRHARSRRTARPPDSGSAKHTQPRSHTQGQATALAVQQSAPPTPGQS